VSAWRPLAGLIRACPRCERVTSHALAVVHVQSGAVIFESTVAADSDGYVEALKLAEEHTPGRRAFAVEGTGSFGAGLTRFLTRRDERVLEVGRLRRERRSGGKTDASTLSAPLAASFLTSGGRRRVRAGNARHCRHWWPHAKER
jgi:hypothetical protein